MKKILIFFFLLFFIFLLIPSYTAKKEDVYGVFFRKYSDGRIEEIIVYSNSRYKQKIDNNVFNESYWFESNFNEGWIEFSNFSAAMYDPSEKKYVHKINTKTGKYEKSVFIVEPVKKYFGTDVKLVIGDEFYLKEGWWFW